MFIELLLMSFGSCQNDCGSARILIGRGPCKKNIYSELEELHKVALSCFRTFLRHPYTCAF